MFFTYRTPLQSSTEAGICVPVFIYHFWLDQIILRMTKIFCRQIEKHKKQRRQRINCRYEQKATQNDRVALSVWNANQIPEICVWHGNSLNREDDGCKLSLSEEAYIQLFSCFIYVSLWIFRFPPINHKTLQGCMHYTVVLSELDNTRRPR
jgi:hypothetical protein